MMHESEGSFDYLNKEELNSMGGLFKGFVLMPLILLGLPLLVGETIRFFKNRGAGKQDSESE